MTSSPEENKLSTFNYWANHWRNVVGANVIPVVSRKKNTYTKWEPYQHNPITDEQHNEWLRDKKFDLGMGLVLGKAWHHKSSGNLFINAIDCDNQIAIDEILNYNGKKLTIEDLARITIVEQHKDDPTKMHIIVYSTNRPFVSKESDKVSLDKSLKIQGNEIPAIEVKSQNAIVFVTPSIHKNGQPYQILGTKEPININDFETHIDNILKKYGIAYLDAANEDGKARTPITDLFNENYKVYENHNRHLALLRVMESLIRRNAEVLPLSEIKEIASNWNNKHCIPPLDTIEFERQWKDATKYIERNREREQRLYPQQDNSDSNQKKIERKTIWKNRDDLYQKLKAEFTFKTLRDSQEILCYDNECGVYRFNGDVKIKQELERMYEEEQVQTLDENMPRTNLLTETDRSEIVARTKWTTIIDRSELEYSNSASIINIKNGLFDIDTKQLRPHSPDYVSIKQFPITYDPQASWVNVLKFLKQIQDIEGVKTLIKMFGYILLAKSTKHQKAFFFAGKGDNGKSVLIDLIEAFVGENNCSSVKLHDLRNDRFMLAQMYGKIVNTYADIPATNLQDVGVFKALVTGDKMTAQHKYGKLFEFRNRAKLIYSGNSIPLSEGEDELAYFKRWVILRFNSLFKGDKQDKDLIKKLTTPENLSGLFNLALVGLDLLEREGFPNIPIQVIREEYDRQSISHKRFVVDRCQINLEKSEYFIVKGDYYNSYLEYCHEFDYEPLTPDQVEVELSVSGIFEKRKTINKVKRDCWSGIITHEEADRRNQEILERQKQNTLG
jgi:P4 family phage/plasmid primase-like protien